MTEVVDLLAALREGTRRGAGREVDLYRPTPSTRGTGEGSWSAGRAQAPPDEKPDEKVSREARIRLRLADGSYDQHDVEWARERLRTPGLLTRGELGVFACDGCTFHRPVVYQGVEIASSPCELDGVCWKAESAAQAKADERPPLWVLRKPNGKPNYRHASEMETFLRESGQLRGDKKATPWEEWVQDDPARVPPADADRSLLADWQIELLDGPTPIEKVAEPIGPASPSSWRQWTGDGEKQPCVVCGEKGGYSVAGRRYCRDHVREAESALHAGRPLPGDIEDTIDLEDEVGEEVAA